MPELPRTPPEDCPLNRNTVKISFEYSHTLSEKQLSGIKTAFQQYLIESAPKDSSILKGSRDRKGFFIKYMIPEINARNVNSKTYIEQNLSNLFHHIKRNVAFDVVDMSFTTHDWTTEEKGHFIKTTKVQEGINKGEDYLSGEVKDGLSTTENSELSTQEFEDNTKLRLKRKQEARTSVFDTERKEVKKKKESKWKRKTNGEIKVDDLILKIEEMPMWTNEEWLKLVTTPILKGGFELELKITSDVVKRLGRILGVIINMIITGEEENIFDFERKCEIGLDYLNTVSLIYLIKVCLLEQF
ncbi:hypothetical protein ABK040_010713 [Willaertia magna]